MTSKQWTCRGLVREGKRRLRAAQIEEAELDARLLFFSVFSVTWNQLLLHYEDMPPCSPGHWEEGEDKRREQLIRAYFSGISRRAAHVPLQYITGEQSFCGFPMEVDERVLIPRQDTEILVEEVLKIWEGRNMSGGGDKEPLTLLDLCTGSGCIPIALARLGHFSAVTAGDISEDALRVANRNAANNHVELELVRSDLFASFCGRHFDVVTANPPYIPSAQIDTLMEEVREHEPRLALDGEKDGLSFYRRIAEEAPEHLTPGGWIFFEIGSEQGAVVQTLLMEHGFRGIRCVKDRSGLDRVVCGRRG